MPSNPPTPEPVIQTLHRELGSLLDPSQVTLVASGCAVAPGNVAEAAAVLRFAYEQHLPVSITGSGSKLGWLNSGTHRIVLQTCRLNSIREHVWQDMTCTVEAGCTWMELQTALGRHSQQVALDPLWPDRASVGGVVASNDSGALRLSYGGLRDLVIGMTVILADGTIAKSGGKVVKNVAGYDLPKLLCGSFGTLALIAEVTFRLHSVAPHTGSFTFHSEAAAALGTLMLRVLNSHLSLQSMQLRTVEANAFALDVRLAALPSVLATQGENLLKMAADLAVSAGPAGQDPWLAREGLFAAGSIPLKMTMLPTGIPAALREIRALGGQGVVQAVGTAIGSVPATTSPGQIGALRTLLEADGGSLVLLDCPPGQDRWGRLPDSFPLMHAVKQGFDPHNILHPGRFLGGI